MKVFNVNDDCFKEYGRILSGYDYSELFEKLSEQEIPDNGIVYKASVAAFEKCGIHDEILLRSFGGYPIQIGYVGGTNRTMKCLEYHKSSELNIAMNDKMHFSRFIALICLWKRYIFYSNVALVGKSF